MRLGSTVPGITGTGYRFVAEDQHDICRRVQEIDADARLAVNVADGQLAIVRRVVLEGDVSMLEMDPHDTWIIAFRVSDPQSGMPLDGEPDARVLERMREYDSWNKRNPVRAKQAAEAVVRHREAQVEKELREHAREMAEAYLWAGRRYFGLKHNIYVPADLARGQG